MSDPTVLEMTQVLVFRGFAEEINGKKKHKLICICKHMLYTGKNQRNLLEEIIDWHCICELGYQSCICPA